MRPAPGSESNWCMGLAENTKLVAADVDGTVVVGGRIATPSLKRIFAQLRERGVTATLCTGRMPHRAAEVADQLGVTEYLICTEGGHVIHRRTGEKLHYPTIAETVVERVARLVQASCEIELAAMCDDVLWATSDLTGRRAHWWGSRWQVMSDVHEVTAPVLLVVMGGHEVVAWTFHTLQQELSSDVAVLHDVEDHGDYAQFKVCDPETDKGIAAEKLVRHLGGDRTQILAFGDYLNDLGIMRIAGYSICPRDAHPEVCRIASYVSAYSAEEGFVAAELRRIFGLA